MVKETSLENLRKNQGYKWKKGQSGNPKGRPKGTLSLTSQLKKYLEADPLRVESLVVALYDMALTGNYQAMNEIFNRVDGKVAERHQLEGQLPIKLVFQPIQAKPELAGQAIEGDYRVIDEPS